MMNLISVIPSEAEGPLIRGLSTRRLAQGDKNNAGESQ